MARFGEARKRRDLVWYGEAGQARHGEIGRNGRGWSRVGSGRYDKARSGKICFGKACLRNARRGMLCFVMFWQVWWVVFSQSMARRGGFW
jgi:hypothetical protein